MSQTVDNGASALAGSRELLAAVLAHLSDGVVVHAANGERLYANDEAARLTGFASAEEFMAAPPDEALGRFELFHPDGSAMRPEELPGRRALAGEEPEPALVRFRRSSGGHERFSRVTAVPIRDERGDVRYTITYFREVTNEHMVARRRGLAAEIGQVLGSTLDYETTLREIAAAAVPRLADSCLVHVLSEDGSLMRIASEHRESDHGLRLDELSARWPSRPGDPGPPRVILTGKPEFAREIDDDALVAVAHDDEHLRALRAAGLLSYMCVPIRVGGSVVAAVTLVTSESGRRFAVEDLVLGQDIAEQAATALENASLYREAKRASALLDSLYDSAPIGLGFWDRDLRYVRVNEALAVINELSAEDHRGRTFAEVIPHFAPVLEQIARNVLESGEPVTAIEMAGGTPSDPQAQRFWLSSYYPVVADGEVLGVGAVVEEVTDRRRAEQRTELQHSVTRILSVADSAGAAVSKVLETVCSALGWDVGCYWPIDPEEPRLTWVREGVNVDGFVELTRRMPLSPTLLPGRVAESGEAEWLEDFSPALFPRISVAQVEGLTSGVGFPILIDGEVAGVLEIFSRARRPRNLELQHTLQAIGGQLGQFLRRKRVEDERVQLLQRERQARAEAESAAATLRKLARVSEVALDRVGLNELLEALLARIVEVLDAHTAAILLIDGNGELSVRATLGLEGELEHARTIPIGAGMAGRVAAARAPTVIPDLREVELVSPVLRERGINSLVAVPLVADDTVIGVVHAGSEAYSHFTGDDAGLLELIAQRISLAIQSAALVEAERAAQERLQFLSEASVTLASSLDLETTLRRAAQLATAHFADAAVIDLVEGDSLRRVVIEVAEGRLSPAVRDGLLANPPSPDDEGGSARVLRTGREEVLADLDTEPGPLAAVIRGRPAISPTVDLLGPRALVYMPLRARARVLGVLALIRIEENFSAGDVETVRELAARAAVAVDNANLYRDAERGRDRLGFLAAASAVLGAELDESSTLERLADLVVARYADWCTFHLAGEEATTLVAAAHRGDGGVAGAAELERGLADAADRAIATGEAELSPRGSGAEPGVGTRLTVPLVARGRTIGAMSWAWVESMHEYNAGDLEFALDLGRRAAAAIDNAHLYREAEERAQAARVLASVGDGVFFVDRRGCVRTWNRAAATATGLRPVDVLDKPAVEAIPGWAAIAARVPVADEFVVSPPRPESLPLDLGARELWLSLHGVAVPDGIVYAFRDLTEERALESMRTEFVSTVSHELRTPLAAIYGAAMTLRRSDVALSDDQRAKMLDVVSGEAERLARTVNDILWASRLDAGSLNVAIGSCDPARLAREVVEAQLAHLDPLHELVLEAPDDLPDVVGDEDKIGRVLINLVDNAIKYSPDGGRVRIELSRVGGSVRFAVTDEGLGVPLSEQRRIFEKFYRLDPNMTRGVGGTGLGLFICRELVRRMDGRIWVESAGLGRGSTFSLELPAA